MERELGAHAPASGVSRGEIDLGLRSYMLQVYNYMGSGLALTGVTAFSVANIPQIYNAIFGTPLAWVVILAPLGIVFFLSARINKMSVRAAQAAFWGFAALLGVSLASLFVIYTETSVARVFFIAASVFGAMSLYGYTTKRDLSAWGSFLFMGLLGIVAASLVNLFLASSMLQFVVSVAGVLVFTGLTAYDTQRIKALYADTDEDQVTNRKAVMGALTLYLDFINLFIMLLHLLGERR